MDLVAPEIDAYAERATTPWPDQLADLDAATREQLGHPSMLSGPVVGRLLETLVALARPRLVLEIGTFSGGSALWMARGLPPEGRIVTCENDAEHAAFARERIAAAGEDHRIELREGPALETIAALDGPFDVVFIDADKEGYPAYLDAVLPKLSPDGLVIADNTLRAGRVLDADPDEATRAILAFNERAASDPGLSSVLLTVRDGLTLIRRA
jgi:caffeoyl-CoA O-methyltransferase